VKPWNSGGDSEPRWWSGRLCGSGSKQERVTHAVRESTGSYWEPVCNIWEESVPIYGAHAHEVKNRKGPQTDDPDGGWLVSAPAEACHDAAVFHSSAADP